MNATLPAPARVPRLLILVVAYQAETTISGVLRRLPAFAGLEVEVLVIDDCSADGTFKVAERLRDGINHAHMRFQGQEVPAPLSIGVAQLQADDDVLDSLLKRADQAMYRAKRAGGDRVEMALAN